jgi:hypothetical protein
LDTLLEVVREASRREVKPSRDNSEQSEGNKLQDNADHGDGLALVDLGRGIGIGRFRGGNHDGTNHLRQECDDVETDEDRGDPASYSLSAFLRFRI